MGGYKVPDITISTDPGAAFIEHSAQATAVYYGGKMIVRGVAGICAVIAYWLPTP